MVKDSETVSRNFYMLSFTKYILDIPSTRLMKLLVEFTSNKGLVREGVKK